MEILIETGKWAAKYMEESVRIAVPAHTTVAEALEKIPLPPDETGLTVIGGKAVARDHILSDRDILKVYPMIIGG